MLGPKAIIEFLGTAILAFTVQVAMASGSDLAPLAIGGIFASLVFAGGPISGAHYNPAITLAVALGGTLPVPDAITYAIAQLVGGILGGLLGGVIGAFAAFEAGAAASTPQALLAEATFAFVLCFVALAVAPNARVADNHYYGLAIGLVVAAGAISAGPVSGGALNPAVALGLSLAGGCANIVYAFLVAAANLLGGAAAAGCFRIAMPATAEAGEGGASTSLYQSVS